MRTSRWVGDPPEKCDICGSPIKTDFFDGRTQKGPWANMCSLCHFTKGIGLGVGKGQHYRKTKSGKFFKIEG